MCRDTRTAGDTLVVKHWKLTTSTFLPTGGSKAAGAGAGGGGGGGGGGAGGGGGGGDAALRQLVSELQTTTCPPSPCLTPQQVEAILKEEGGGDGAVVAFRCGHHFRVEEFHVSRDTLTA